MPTTCRRADFEATFEDLLRLRKGRRAAIMCAEAVPWRCHRSLIADALAGARRPGGHIMSETLRKPHELTKFARIQDGRVSYRPPNLGLFDS